VRTSVLLTCAGQRAGIVAAFRQAGALTVAADANPLAPVLFHADRQAIVPPVNGGGYIEAIRELVCRFEVRLIVPLTDLDQLLLADARHDIDGALLLLPDRDVVEAVNDKYLAHKRFLALGIPSPPTWLPSQLPDELRFPVLVKARAGFGSRHIYRCDNREQLDFFLTYTPVPSIVQEFCQGEEFSLDVFSDLKGRCLNAIPRTMIQAKGGESIKGTTIKDWKLIQHGRFVAETLRLVGPATIQCFSVNGDYLVTDINPRFGGGFHLPHAAGSRYPELALALANGEQPQPQLGQFRSHLTMSLFFDTIIVAPQAAHERRGGIRDR
jgi:carbamoyl-phosphate synthase large subunit